MGSRMVRFSFTPGENEQIEAVVKLPEEKRSIIHGVVRDHKNKLLKDAVVKLFEVLDPHDKCAMKPITHTFTDDCGQFLFGPLYACKHYAIKIWVNNIKIRELIVHPDDCHDHDPCHDPCHEDDHDDGHNDGHKPKHSPHDDDDYDEHERNDR